MSEYGIPHPIHTVFAAERIVVESIPSLTFAEVGITPGLSDVLETSGISTVGQLSNLTDTDVYNLPSPIDYTEYQELRQCLAKVGLSITEENDRSIFGHRDE